MSIRDEVMKNFEKIPSWVEHLDRPRDKGDKITGKVLEAEMAQQYAFDSEGKIDTSKPLFWDEAQTRPKKSPVAVIDTEEFGKTRVFFSGNAYTALKKELTAMEEDGRREEADLLPGDTLTVEIIGKGVPKSRNFQPPLLYKVNIKPGKGAVGKAMEEEEKSSARAAKSASTGGSGRKEKSPATASEIEKPEGIRQALWDQMTEEDRVAMVAGF